MDRQTPFDHSRSARIFVGRRQALETLLATADEARQGRGALVLISGEPGIGKTRLAEELGRRATGLDVHWGLCSSGGGEPAYWPWTQVLRQCVRRAEAGANPLPADLVAAVEPLLTLTASEHEPAAVSAAIGTVTSADPMRLVLFDAAAQLLERAAARAPLCLLFDDLHAADEASLRLAHFVARRLRHLPILVVATHRDAEVREQAATAAVFADLVRESQGVALRAFDDDEVRDLVEAVGAAPASPELIARLQAATGGNAFFLDEVVRQLARDGAGGNGLDAASLVPERARAVIRLRIERLAMHDLEVLEVAAVAGKRFDPAILATVLDRPTGWVREHTGTLERDGLIAPAGSSGHWEFRHDIVRAAVQSDLSTERRARLHHAITTAVEVAYADDLDRVRSALAWHAFAALPVGDARRALEHCRLAGERAARLLAYEEAVAHFDRALAVAAQLGCNDGPLYCDLLLSLGDAAFRAGDVERSTAAFDEVVARARTQRDGARLGRALLGYSGPVEAGAVDQRRVGLIEEALAWLPAAPSPLRARLLSRLAWELYWSHQASERRRSLVAQAIEMARALDDPGTLAYTLSVVRFAVWSRSDDQGRLGAASEIIRLAEQANDPVLAMEGHHWRVVDLLEQGDVTGVDRELQAHDRRARSFGIPHYVWWTALWRAMRALLAGRFTEAETLIGEALELGSEVHPANASAAMSGQMFTLLMEQGKEDALASLSGVYEATENWTTITAEVSAGLAWVAAELGQMTNARRGLEPFRRDGVASLMTGSSWLTSSVCVAAAAAAGGEPGLCMALYGILLPCAEQVVVVGPALASFGTVARFLGILATALDRFDDAERHLRGALDLSRRMQSPPFIARTQHDLGALYLRRDGAGDRERARAVLRDALAESERLGMQRVAARARDMLAQCEELTSAPPPAEAEHGWRRDGEYWALTFDGTTVHVRNSLGLRCLARLLAAPNVEQPALVLASELPRAALPAVSDTGPRLDARARAEYGRRLTELAEEREEAHAAGDLGRAERAASERERIEDELSRALGLGGRIRRDGSPVERARQNVTKAIKKAIARIDAVHPSLGAHLTRAVRTGTQCVYVLEPRAGIRWLVSEHGPG